MREARKRVTFAIFAAEEDLNKVTAIVDALFTLLRRSLNS
jgi:type I restriction enzyme R subunit